MNNEESCEKEIEENKDSKVCKDREEIQFNEEERIKVLNNEIKDLSSNCTNKTFNKVLFNPDDDTNFHIDFIHATANLRARNYRITECDQLKTKLITGKIIPAIATTTAMIVGAVGMELVKVVQGFDKIEDYRNGFVDLAIPLFVFTEPIEANKAKDVEMDPIMFGPIKAIPEGWTIWDTIEVRGSRTIQEFLDWLKDTYKVATTLVSSGTLAVYNSYLPGKKHAPRLSRKIEDVYREIGTIVEGRNYLILEVEGSTIDDNIDFKMPKFKYIFQ